MPIIKLKIIMRFGIKNLWLKYTEVIKQVGKSIRFEHESEYQKHKKNKI